MSQPYVTTRKLICLVLMILCLAPTVGCVGLFANFLNVMGAGLIPPAYAGLKDKKVAVVCVSNSQLFGPTSTSSQISTRMSRLLANHVKGIEVVPPQQIEDWIDRNGWDMIDFQAIGKGVEAEVVVAVDVRTFSLHDGATMLKGRGDFDMVVYDITTGQEVFSRSPPQIEFPTTSGVSTTSTSEREFKRLFLDTVATRLARNFYPFDMNDDVAADVAKLSRM